MVLCVSSGWRGVGDLRGRGGGFSKEVYPGKTSFLVHECTRVLDNCGESAARARGGGTRLWRGGGGVASRAGPAAWGRCREAGWSARSGGPPSC